MGAPVGLVTRVPKGQAWLVHKGDALVAEGTATRDIRIFHPATHTCKAGAAADLMRYRTEKRLQERGIAVGN